MGIVTAERVKNFAYHGCMPIEAEVGTWFETTVIVEVDLSKAAESDKIEEAIDYCVLVDAVHDQMAIRSNLIENVAQRIIDQIRSQYHDCESITVEIRKLNAPVNGDVEAVSVTVDWAA